MWWCRSVTDARAGSRTTWAGDSTTRKEQVMAGKATKEVGVTFGAKLRYSSSRKFDYSVSDDAKAFELRLNPALAAGVGSPSFAGLGKTKAPIGTRLYAAVIPAMGKDVKTSLSLNGFFVAEPGTTVTVVVVANDQHSVTHFAHSKNDQGFTTTVPVRAKALREIRLSVAVIAERDDEHPDASAMIAVSSIGADTFIPKKPSPKKRS
jgi:hypothetical protein